MTIEEHIPELRADDLLDDPAVMSGRSQCASESFEWHLKDHRERQS
jgi:hypothetical protein